MIGWRYLVPHGEKFQIGRIEACVGEGAYLVASSDSISQIPVGRIVVVGEMRNWLFFEEQIHLQKFISTHQPRPPIPEPTESDLVEDTEHPGPSNKNALSKEKTTFEDVKIDLNERVVGKPGLRTDEERLQFIAKEQEKSSEPKKSLKKRFRPNKKPEGGAGSG